VASAAAMVVLAAGGWAAYSADLLRTHPAQAGTPSIATGTALVQRTDVRQQTPVTGTLGHAGNYSVIAPASTAGANPANPQDVNVSRPSDALVARLLPRTGEPRSPARRARGRAK